MKTLNKILFVIALGTMFQSCALYKIPKLAKQGEVKSSNYVRETPFSYTNNVILVDVVINGKTFNFVFDTGAELSVIGRHIADEIDYKVIASSKIKATKKSEQKVEFIEIPKISFADVGFENTGAIIADIAHFDEIFGCHTIDGIIGNNLMRKSSWQIDYKNQKIRFSDNVEKLDVSKNASEITMDAGEIRNVYLDVTIDGVSSEFIFDTGYSGKIKADSSFFNLLVAKNKDLEYSTETGIAHSDINGNITGQTFNTMVKSIDVEGIVMSNQVISLAGNNNYLVGNKFFEDYTLTIDWENDKLFFDPTNEVEADTLKGYELSFYPNYKTKKVAISRFQDDHTLAEKISVDAEIVTINGVDVSNFSLEEMCTYWQREGEGIRNYKTLDIVVLDKGVNKKVKLTKKVLLPKS